MPAHMHTCAISLFLSLSKTSGQSFGTVGGYGVIEEEEGKKGGTTLLHCPSHSLSHTQTDTHFVGSQRTFGASVRTVGVGMWAFPEHRKTQQKTGNP